MGHLLTSPLPQVADLESAKRDAAARFAADSVVPFTPVFYQAWFGPIAVFPGGRVEQAEIIADPSTGFPRVVVAS